MANTAPTRREVIQRELEWHEQEAHRRYSVDTLLYDPPAFDTVLNGALDFLAPQPGDLVLDIACGEGKETLALARRGALVISQDLSHNQLVRTRERLASAGLADRVFFVQGNAEEPPFAAESFGLIYGKAIIHHLDTDLSAGQIDRLLQPGGKATFAEPLAQHPLIELGRRLTPQMRTADEQPLLLPEFERFASLFDTAVVETFFLTAPLAYVVRRLPGGERPFRVVHRWLRGVDTAVFKHLPRLRRWAWYALVNLQKQR